MGGTMEMAAKFEEVLKTGDFAGISALTKEYATDDFVEPPAWRADFVERMEPAHV
jgi:hypothetical protein